MHLCISEQGHPWQDIIASSLLQVNVLFSTKAAPESMLTHWGWDKMAAIKQTTLSIAFSLMKKLEFRLNFHWSLFLRVQLTVFQHWFRKWLGAVQATSHYLNQWCLVYWRIYASLSLNELISCQLDPKEQISQKSESKHNKLNLKNMHMQMSSAKCLPFCSGPYALWIQDEVMWRLALYKEVQVVFRVRAVHSFGWVVTLCDW